MPTEDFNVSEKKDIEWQMKFGNSCSDSGEILIFMAFVSPGKYKQVGSH